jgi:hypothetical protein
VHDQSPGFGLPSGTVSAVYGAVPVDQSPSLLADIFGASLPPAPSTAMRRRLRLPDRGRQGLRKLGATLKLPECKKMC